MIFAFVVRSGPDAPRRVRRKLREQLNDELDSTTERDLELLISEVVTNAVRYGTADRRSDIKVQIRLDGDKITAHIADSGPGFSPATRPKPRVERGAGGFGLFLLDQLSTRWGVQRDETGFRVWFRLARGSSGSAPSSRPTSA